MLTLKGLTGYNDVCGFDLQRIVLKANNTDWNSTRSLYITEEKGKFEGLFRIGL